jgi:hypothetical protein
MNAAERALRSDRRERTAVEIVADLIAGAESLAEQVRFWSAILPRTGAISTAQATAAGIERTLQELRGAMRELESPSPKRAA